MKRHVIDTHVCPRDGVFARQQVTWWIGQLLLFLSQRFKKLQQSNIFLKLNT